MITQSKPEFSTASHDIFGSLLRHKKKASAAFVLTIAATAAIIVFWPRKYRSEAKLFVQVGRESVSLDPTATTGQVVPVALSRETEVNSVLEMLHSRIMIEKLVDEIGPEKILHPVTPGATPQAKSADQAPSAMSKLVALVDIDPVSDREKAIIHVTKSLGAAVEKKSDVITISGTAKSPELAQLIVGKFVEIYFGEHARMHRTAGSQSFFAEQKALLQKNLSDALAKLRDAKNELGILSIETQREVLRDETVAVENKLAQLRASLAASHDKVGSLRQKVERLPARLVTDDIQGFPNAAADTMRQDLYHLEIREAELSSRFNNDFPALVAVRAQIETAKKPLNREEHRRSQQTTGVNLVHDQLQVGLLSEEANAASLEAETKSLDKQMAQLRDRTRLLNERELQIANLDQEVTLCKTNYATYSEKSEQSRIDAALQNERITNVNVIQPANLVGKPVSPQKLVLLIAGVLGGLMLAVGIALLAEYLASPSYATSEIEERLTVPALTPIPEIAPRRAVLK